MCSLLDPFTLKHLTLRNRIVSTSHAPNFVENGHPRNRYRLYHEEKAKGGVALTMTGGSTNIAPESPSVFGQLYAGDDSIIPWFQKLTDRVHAHGAAVMCQITHMGCRTVWVMVIGCRHLPIWRARAGASGLSQGDGATGHRPRDRRRCPRSATLPTRRVRRDRVAVPFPSAGAVPVADHQPA